MNDILNEIPETNAQWEIYFLKRKIYSVEGKDLEIDRKMNAVKEIFSIRVIKDKKVGFSSCNEKNKIGQSFESALNIAKISDFDEFYTLPEPEKISHVQVFDDELINMKELMPQFLIDMQKSALFDKKIKKLRNAQITITISEKGIMNSKGVSIYQPLTTITAYVIAVAEDKNSQMGWSYRAERFIKNIQFEDIGREAGSKALMLLNPKKITPFKGCAVLSPLVACEFLGLLSKSLSAENYQTGKSLFIDKFGHIVINESLNIIDDGLIPQRFGSIPFDDEGVATSRKVLIKKGVLNSLLHNTYTASRAKTHSTGNAIRSDKGITVGPTNFYIDAEKRHSLEDLIKMIHKGIYIVEVMGMHTANPISGDFSVGISGVYVEKGEFKYPVKEAVASGNISEIFKNILAIGEDLKFFGNIGSPTLLVEGVDISG